MQLVILADEAQQEELSLNAMEAAKSGTIKWIRQEGELAACGEADVIMDLLFTPTPGRIRLLQNLLPKTVIINSVAYTLSETDPDFIRMAGWPGFLSASLVEGAGREERHAEAAEAFGLLGKSVEWLPDEPGLVTPRVISMIINEAYLALEEGVSTREAIDTAMKLGTNYPYGPFEWAEKIGVSNIYHLLQVLARTNQRYTPACRLQSEPLLQS